MNVQVKHNGSDITTHVISYETETKICTGIGVLNLVVSLDSGLTFSPWDSISIYEEGIFQKKYYVSETAEELPSATLTVQCQDNSKRLVDYFIPDSYVVDYPSYTRYWIEKFLAEAGVTYQFLTDSPGNLLSNFTSLGLTSAYEQLLQLLQLSGWYMYFDGNGKAFIGSLTTDLGEIKENFSENDILQISLEKDDKMLRNRVVVWGAYDPIYSGVSIGEVSTHTPWNYDNKDYRTIVISNSNIPNSSSCYSIANTLIKEFAKITVEKHFSAHGSRNLNLGEMVHVNSRAYYGNGMITTYGTRMDRNGLVTNIVLDERCPRLFGFFDFGDAVYVGTYGDGVWKKHIKFDPTWYNFSSGLEDPAVTDLHVNNGLFSSVSASGDMYYAINDVPWHKLTVSGLESSAEDNITASGSLLSGVYTPAIFSGIKARATIVDRINNRILFGVDTYSGINYGDYFLALSGMMNQEIPSGYVVLSGVVGSGGSGDVVSSGYRGWILEYSPYSGFDVYNSYPINISGNYNITVVDIENDGVNDFVSVASRGEIIIPSNDLGYNLGSHISQNPSFIEDRNNKVSTNVLWFFNDPGRAYHTSFDSDIFSVFDNEMLTQYYGSEKELVYYYGGELHRKIISKTWDEINQQWSLSSYEDTVTLTPMTILSYIGITKVSDGVYNLFLLTGSSTSTYITYNVGYKQIDTNLNIEGSFTIISSVTIDKNSAYSTDESIVPTQTAIINGNIYFYATRTRRKFRGASPIQQSVSIYGIIINATLMTETTSGLLFHQDFQDGTTGFPPFWTINWLRLFGSAANPSVFLFQKGTNVSAFLGILEYELDAGEDARSWFIYSNDGITFTSELIQETDHLTTDPSFIYSNQIYDSNGNRNNDYFQLTGEHFVAYNRKSNNYTLVYNGESISIIQWSTIPLQLVNSNVRQVLGNTDNYYLANLGGTWFFCNPQTFSLEVEFSPPLGYTIVKPFSSTDSISARYYWHAIRDSDFKDVIFKSTTSTVLETAETVVNWNDSTTRGVICGNFFIGIGSPMSLLYLNNDTDVPNAGLGFTVLQRDGNDFNVIQRASYPIRIDISNTSPLLTVQSGSDSFVSNFIFGNELTIVDNPIAPEVFRIEDYRYAFLETVSSGVVISGITQKTLLSTVGSGIYYDSVETLSGLQLLMSIPSGLAGRIETSNYVPSGQYIFVTTSGENPMFYQKDPADLFFTAYSGLPISRATIIRVDDRF